MKQKVGKSKAIHSQEAHFEGHMEMLSLLKAQVSKFLLKLWLFQSHKKHLSLLSAVGFHTHYPAFLVSMSSRKIAFRQASRLTYCQHEIIHLNLYVNDVLVKPLVKLDLVSNCNPLFS